MWHSGRGVTNASVLWRRARNAVAAATFARPVTFIRAPASCHWGLNASHGFARPYTWNSKQETERIVQELEKLGLSRDEALELFWLPDDTESTTTDNVKSSGAAEQSENDDPCRSPWRIPPARPPRDPQDSPAVSFELSVPTTIETLKRSDPEEIYRLAGYSSDLDTIHIHFEQHVMASLRRPMKLSKLYLRDICQCSRCLCPSTGQKTFATCDVFPLPRVLNPETENIRLSADGSLEITWKDDFLTGDNHTSVYSERFLNCLAQGDGRDLFKAHFKTETWDAETFERGMRSREVAFHDWMEGGAAFARAVLNLHEYGLVFMHGAPKSEDCVRMIAEKIGNLQSTIHGLTWDIISEPGGGIAACADERLHQDLLYIHEQPQVQVLHCLENGSMGNIFLFSDGFHSARALRGKDKRAFRTLSTQMVNYRYREAGKYFSHRRPVIRGNTYDIPLSIAWSPASQGPFRISEYSSTLNGKAAGDGTLRGWSRAARAFRDEVESSENVVTYAPRPGDCVIFDSRRILQGSKQLVSQGGRKHLRAACIDPQTLRSAFVGLVEKGLLRRMPGGRVIAPFRSIKGFPLSEFYETLGSLDEDGVPTYTD